MDESAMNAELVAFERIETAAREADSVLSLTGLGLAEVPESIKTLKYLTHLDLSGNRLTELPEWLSELTALELLELRGNRLVQLPPSLARLSRLAQLDAADNQLVQVPPALASLPRLSVLELSGNPRLLEPPPAIVARGSHAVLDCLRALGDTAGSAAEITLPSGIPPCDPAQDAPTTHGARRRTFLIGVPVLVIGAVVAVVAAMAGAGPGQKPSSSASLTSGQVAAAGTVIGSPGGEAAAAGSPTTKGAPASSPEPTRSAGRSSTSATPSTANSTSNSATAGAGAYPTAAPDVDLALARPVTASSAMGNYVASNAVDGNPNTYWESRDGTAFPQTLTVDLGAMTTVGRFDFRLPRVSAWNERTETFSILGSSDGTDFFTIDPAAVYTFNANAASDDSASLTIRPVHTRYIELSFTATNGWPAAQIGDLEVYS